MSFFKRVLPVPISTSVMLSLSLLLLSGCNPAPNTAQQENKGTQTQSEASQPIVVDQQTATSGLSPNDEIPVLSAEELKHYEETGTLPDDVSEVETEVQAEALQDEQFEVRTYRAESQGSLTGYIDKINVTSLNDQPTTITGIQINRGNCAVTSMYDYKNMRYGSIALVYPRCKIEQIREIRISTVNGTYAFQMR